MTTTYRDYLTSLNGGGSLEMRPSKSDYGHVIVSRFRADGTKELLGHIYTEIDGDQKLYRSLNRKGREIFPRIDDFNEVERKFERYARLREIQERVAQVYQEPLVVNSQTILNSNQMKTPNNANEQNRNSRNQIIFIEYEHPTGDGHIITAVDGYRNIIGRIHRSYNDETKKYEYSAFDHTGKMAFKNEKLWQIKNEFYKNKEHLLEQAHQRRIERNKKSVGKIVKEDLEEQQKTVPIINAPDKNPSRTQKREQELNDIREEQDQDRGDMDLDMDTEI